MSVEEIELRNYCYILYNYRKAIVNFRVRRRNRAQELLLHFLRDQKLKRDRDLVTMMREFKRKVCRVQRWWRQKIMPRLKVCGLRPRLNQEIMPRLRVCGLRPRLNKKLCHVSMCVVCDQDSIIHIWYLFLLSQFTLCRPIYGC